MSLRPMMRPNFFKETTWRCREYIEFVMQFPCCNTPCAAVPPNILGAHHGGKGTRGTAIKCSDAFVAPLCWDCHAYWHQHGTLPGKDRAESEALQYEAQRLCLAKFVESRIPSDE